MTSFPVAANHDHWWLTTEPRWKRLHAVPGTALDASDEDMLETLCEPPWPVLAAVCGWTGEMTMPGVLSRLSLQRCGHCCRKLGIKPGNGTPANEAHRETMAIVMTAMREAQDPRASAPVAGEEQDR